MELLFSGAFLQKSSIEFMGNEMSQIMINVSKDFTRMPCVRHRADGPFSGEEFREDILLPALQAHDKVVVNLEGCLALGSSFLDEAFAGLVRAKKYTAKELQKKLIIKFSVESYVDEAWNFIRSA